MILPSAINPLYVFRLDEPVFFQTNFYGPDRGGYIRKLPTNFSYRLYFQSDAVCAVSIVRCDNSAVTFIGNATLITGNYYYIQIPVASWPENVSHYFKFVKAGETALSELFVSLTPTKPSITEQTIVTYSNKKLYQGIQPNTLITAY